MCTSHTHDTLGGYLECYMDDLVDYFGEFVKKSMLAISVAVGTLALMVIYVFKLMTERAPSRRITFDMTAHPKSFNKSCQVSIQGLTKTTANNQNLGTNSKSLVDAYRKPSANGNRAVSLQVIPDVYPNFDDKFSKEIEVCIISKPCETCKQTQVNEDLKSLRIEYQLTTTTRQTCISKNHLSVPRRCSKVIAERNSCCSICCEDKRYRK